MTRALLVDLSERCVWTFVEAFLGTVTGAALLGLDVAPIHAGAVAGLSAVLAVVKGFAGSRLRGSAALGPRS